MNESGQAVLIFVVVLLLLVGISLYFSRGKEPTAVDLEEQE